MDMSSVNKALLYVFFNFHRSSITFSPDLWYTKLTCHVAIHYCVGVNFVTRYK